MAHDGLRFGVLGPLKIWHGGEQVLLRGRERAVLGLLALNPNVAIDREIIIEVLWGGAPPGSAISIVQTYISRLRSVFNAVASQKSSGEFLFGGGSSYMLKAQDHQLDLLAFDSLIERGRRAATAGKADAALDAYGEALGLWRGAPLADIDILQSYAGTLELVRRWTEVVIDHARISIAGGAYERALPFLHAVVARDPFHEPAYAQLLVALAGSGHQAAALRIYADVRRRLDAQLGVSPSAELRDAYTRVLRQETAPARGACGPVAWRPLYQLPAAPREFAGRADECALIHLRLVEDRPGVGVPVVAISGMPGVGKTALALRAAHALRTRFPDGQLWVSLDGAAGHPRDPGEVLFELLLSFGLRASSIPRSTGMRAATFRSLLAGRRVLVIADDAATTAQVLPLMPGAAGCALLVTSRGHLTFPGGETKVILRPLPPANAVLMLTDIVGQRVVDAEPEAAAQLVKSCGCLPLAIRIVGTRLAALPDWPLSVMVDRLARQPRPLDELETGELSVRGSLLCSYQALGRMARAALRVIGALGHEYWTETMIASALEAAETGRCLNELINHSLVIPSGMGEGGEPRYAIHPLVRYFAVEMPAGAA
jgi:DNA-binding SARP family transcriptional activator